MTAKPPSQLLYDSEATLRLVDTAILDMGELGATSAAPLEDGVRDALGGHAPPSGLVGLSDLLARGYADIVGALSSLRQSRHLLEQASVEKIHHTHERLREVSATTEDAATDILNGLDRATSMVGELDAIDAGNPDGRSAVVRAALRDEIFSLIGHMQFQDITSQQLDYASAVLSDMEVRLAHMAKVFDPAASGIAPPFPSPDGDAPNAFDPDASTLNRAERQAVADEIIAIKRHRA